MELTSATDWAALAEEQAALRRVATLVAAQPSPQEVFTAVTEAVGTLLGADVVWMQAFGEDGRATVIAGWSADGEQPPIGARLPLDDDGVGARIFRSGAPARVDSDVRLVGETADGARELRLRSSVGAPIVVGGRLWGAQLAGTRSDDPLPADAERLVAAFSELVATAIANTEARRELERVADEQHALRRAATLAASGASPREVFAAITTSASELFEVPFASLLRYGPDETATMVAGCAACSGFVGQSWTVPGDDPGVVRVVVGSRRPARIEDHSGVHGPLGEAARSLGVGSVVGVPVMVDDSVWGVLAIGAARDGLPLPADAADRLVGFTEVVTTTLINGEARDEVRSLLAEQETLRRVATLIAKGADPDTVFVTVCDEAAALFGAEQAAAVRLEADELSLVVVGLSALLGGASAAMRGITIGMRSEPGEWPTTTAACRTGRAARRDVTAEQTAGTGPVPDLIRAAGFLSTVSAPIFVDGRVWGAMVVSDSRRVLPADTERRIENFTELIATAIANREAREALAVSEARARALANEQAALRRVATLAARESSPVEILEAVADEAARVLEVNVVGMLRFEPDATATLVAQSETPRPPLPLATSFTLEGENIVASVHRTGRAARMDDWESATGAVAGMASVLGIRSAVASPIVVEGRLWGTMVAASNQSKPLPADTESRIVEFVELLATAISNAESREALMRLADEQAALRRVATLVAEGAAPEGVFDAVLHEVEQMFNQPITALMRYDADGFATVLSSTGGYLEAKGPRWPVDGDGVVARVRESGRAAHIDYAAGTPGALAEAAWGEGLRHGIGVPVVVDGAVWGVMAVGARAPVAVAGEFERRVEKLTELLATAIANATTHADLLKSRARVVSAADETRRRLERDLHDGIQQWLVALALKARKAAGLVAAGASPVQELSGLADDLIEVTEELREISQGIHPAILSDAGLDDALEALARRSAIRVDLDVSFEGRYDPTLEATVYYVVAESITNAVKHAGASAVAVCGGLRGEALELEIEDQGVGGADPGRGTGLIGLKDRVDALGGTISLASPAGAGTTIRVRLPVSPRDGEQPLGRSEQAVSAPTTG